MRASINLEVSAFTYLPHMEEKETARRLIKRLQFILESVRQMEDKRGRPRRGCGRK